MKTALVSLALITFCAAGAIGAASAEPANSGADFAIKFSYDKSELATEAGQRAMLARMEKRVRTECVPITRETARETPEARKCVDAAMRKAIQEINSGGLASLYTSRTAG
jgi:UrcA family protein